jgi:hypothetical protein
MFPQRFISAVRLYSASLGQLTRYEKEISGLTALRRQDTEDGSISLGLRIYEIETRILGPAFPPEERKGNHTNSAQYAEFQQSQLQKQCG